MPKGPQITDDIKMLIADLHRDHPKWTNKKIRLEVQKIIHREDKALAREWPSWPSTFSIDRIMPEIRERLRASQVRPDALDNAWTIQSIAKYPIAPESLPSVLETWFFVQDFKSELKSDVHGPSPLTIRQAQWVARLHAAIKDTKALLGYSMIMADFERQAEVAGLDYFGSQWTTLEVFGELTGRTFTRQEMEKTTGLSGHYVTRVGLDKLRSRTKETNK